MKNIYLDTNVFYTLDFNVYNDKFDELLALAEELGITLYTSDIVVDEIKSGLAKDWIGLSKMEAQIQKRYFDIAQDGFKSQSPIVKERASDALEDLEDFFTKISILKRIDLKTQNLMAVFDDYFNKEGCFSSSNKPKEFPDAFQFELIKDHLEPNDTCIVSSDGDMQSASKRYQYDYRKNLTEVLQELRKIKHNNGIYFDRNESILLFRYLQYEHLSIKELQGELELLGYPDMTKSELVDTINALHKKGVVKFYEFTNSCFSEKSDFNADCDYVRACL
ncbi:PIN domain-containing protein [Photobacterium sagamiensis]|uniref:PIN domain-containing protein n=1 Tax=Photobacterium sagamiensis TaxID=2910241 RepID=UPI003D0C7CD4